MNCSYCKKELTEDDTIYWVNDNEYVHDECVLDYLTDSEQIERVAFEDL